MPTPVDVQNFDTTTPGSTPTGWALAAGHAVVNVGAAARSGTNVLVSTTSSAVVSYPTTQDSNAGKTSWGFSLNVVGTQAGGGGQYCIMQFRLVSTPSVWGSNTCYALYFVPTTTAGSALVYLVKRISGAETQIGSTVSVPYSSGTGIVWNTWYDILIIADEVSTNTSINIQIQRPNGDYLNSSAAWQSTQAYVISQTSNVAALKANSNVAMLLSQSTGATGIYYDNSDYESLASGTTTVNGTAAMIGDALLAATGTAIVLGTGAMVGVSSLAAAAKVIVNGAAAMTGVGLLTPAGLVISQATAQMIGVGSEGASGTVITPAQAAMIGVGALSSNGSVKVIGQAAFSGIAALGANAGGVTNATAHLVGVALMSAGSRRKHVRLIIVTPSAHRDPFTVSGVMG